jgi:hypothetical protein
VREDCLIKHELVGQTPHLDKPIDHFAAAPDCEQSVLLAHQGHYAEIDIRRKPAIEAHFLTAIGLAGPQGSEVEERIMDRLLELVDTVAGDEDPRHVGLFDFDRPRAVSIGLPRTQEPYLLVGGDTQKSILAELGLGAGASIAN